MVTDQLWSFRNDRVNRRTDLIRVCVDRVVHWVQGIIVLVLKRKVSRDVSHSQVLYKGCVSGLRTKEGATDLPTRTGKPFSLSWHLHEIVETWSGRCRVITAFVLGSGWKWGRGGAPVRVRRFSVDIFHRSQENKVWSRGKSFPRLVPGLSDTLHKHSRCHLNLDCKLERTWPSPPELNRDLSNP